MGQFWNRVAVGAVLMGALLTVVFQQAQQDQLGIFMAATASSVCDAACCENSDCGESTQCAAYICNEGACVTVPTNGPGCCGGSVCESQDACHDAACRDNVCVQERKDDCCVRDSECNDGKECTTDNCDGETNSCEASPPRELCCEPEPECEEPGFTKDPADSCKCKKCPPPIDGCSIGEQEWDEDECRCMCPNGPDDDTTREELCPGQEETWSDTECKCVPVNNGCTDNPQLCQCTAQQIQAMQSCGGQNTFFCPEGGLEKLVIRYPTPYPDCSCRTKEVPIQSCGDGGDDGDDDGSSSSTSSDGGDEDGDDDDGGPTCGDPETLPVRYASPPSPLPLDLGSGHRERKSDLYWADNGDRTQDLDPELTRSLIDGEDGSQFSQERAVPGLSGTTDIDVTDNYVYIAKDKVRRAWMEHLPASNADSYFQEVIGADTTGAITVAGTDSAVAWGTRSGDIYSVGLKNIESYPEASTGVVTIGNLPGLKHIAAQEGSLNTIVAHTNDLIVSFKIKNDNGVKTVEKETIVKQTNGRILGIDITPDGVLVWLLEVNVCASCSCQDSDGSPIIFPDCDAEDLRVCPSDPPNASCPDGLMERQVKILSTSMNAAGPSTPAPGALGGVKENYVFRVDIPGSPDPERITAGKVVNEDGDDHNYIYLSDRRNDAIWKMRFLRRCGDDSDDTGPPDPEEPPECIPVDLCNEGEYCPEGPESCVSCEADENEDGEDDVTNLCCEPNETPETDDDCVPTLCGNGELDPGETCDDDNVEDDDGCSSQCQLCDGDGICDATEDCSCFDCIGEQDGCSESEVCGFDPSSGEAMCVPCDGNGICDANEDCTCFDCIGEQDGCSENEVCGFEEITGEAICVPCDGDGLCDANEDCTCFDCLGEQDGCAAHEVCGLDPSNGEPVCVACNGNGVCDAEESCTCNDCLGEQDGCEEGEVCGIDPVSEAPICTTCGNGVCDSTETCQSCILDCLGQQDGCSAEEVCIVDPETDQGVCGADPCGNTVQDFGEECDDGNLDIEDGCDGQCRKEYCGDGVTQPIVVNLLPGVPKPLPDLAYDSAVGGVRVLASLAGVQMSNWLAQVTGGQSELVELCDDGNRNDADACNNVCQPTGNTCGDGTCDDDETCSSCPVDCIGEQDSCEEGEICALDPSTNEPICSPCNGDGTCQQNETCQCEDCHGDDDVCQGTNECVPNNDGNYECLPCGNGICDSTETCSSCPIDCIGQQDSCEEGEICAFDPESGEPVCTDCNADGVCQQNENCQCEDCHGSGELCGGNEVCAPDEDDVFECRTCGNGICESTETCSSCPIDCIGQQDGCAAGEVCSFDPTTNEPVCAACDGNGICDDDETCQCLDCHNKTDACSGNETCLPDEDGMFECRDCGNGVCDSDETCASCIVDCAGEQAQCPANQTCVLGEDDEGVCGTCDQDGICDENESCDCGDCVGRRTSCPGCISHDDCAIADNGCFVGICLSDGRCDVVRRPGALANCCLSNTDCSGLSVSDPFCQESRCVSGVCAIVDKPNPPARCGGDCITSADCSDLNTANGCTIGSCENFSCIAKPNPNPPSTCPSPDSCQNNADCNYLNRTCERGVCQNGECETQNTCPNQCGSNGDCDDLDSDDGCEIGLCIQGQCAQRENPNAPVSCDPECTSHRDCADLNSADQCNIGLCEDFECVQKPNPNSPPRCTPGRCDTPGDCVEFGTGDGCFIGVCQGGFCQRQQNPSPPAACFPPECESNGQCASYNSGDGCLVGVCVQGYCEQVQPQNMPASCLQQCTGDTQCASLRSSDGCLRGACVDGFCQQLPETNPPASCQDSCQTSADCTDMNSRDGCTIGLCLNGQCEQSPNPSAPAACFGSQCGGDADCNDFNSAADCTVGRCLNGFCEAVPSGQASCADECATVDDCIEFNSLCTLGACENGRCTSVPNPGAILQCVSTCANDSACSDLSTADGCKVGLCIDGLCQQHEPASAPISCGSLCGNGRTEPGEECDQGDFNGRPDGNCTASCKLLDCDTSCPDEFKCIAGNCVECTLNAECAASQECRAGECVSRCGNGVVESNIGEQCDDGNSIPADGCSASCLRESDPAVVCGDGRLGDREQCDDGNAMSGDGCSFYCRIESSVVAAGELCGNGLRESGEECDDGNRSDFDGCGATCFFERGLCGDEIVQLALGEQCEPTTHRGDLPYRCGNNCRYVLMQCGNGFLDFGEECDEGGGNSNLPNALCRSDCRRGSCGDGIIDNGELCDDGNLVPGDGCSRFCQFDRVVQWPIADNGTILFPTSPSPALMAMLSPFNLRGSALPLPTDGKTPNTGPIAISVMAAGAAAGWSWMRRRRP